MMKLQKFLTLLLLTLPCAAHADHTTAAETWGQTPCLTVVGNHLEDPSGRQVMLHGIMDTPSPYFCGNRFTDNHWIDVYTQGDNYIDKCKTYFNELFTAATDTAQGSWCNVFRLHMDPCWTDDPNLKNSSFKVSGDKIYDPHGTEVSGEASIYHFSKSRLSTYLNKLYLPLAKLAQGHGMYVIMRPPGVCPSKIQVGDYYQKYLLTVWDTFTKNATASSYSDWLSIELANEPIAVLDADGKASDHAMYDFFQPIVEKCRANGWKGIIWIPGGSWQQDYKGYKSYPIEGDNIGYAVHFYPGWYNTSDSSYDPTTTIRSFLNNVPVVKTSPVMITEVDWSPENPNGEGHKNESGQWVLPNYGTWATGSTSKFGVAYRAMLDYFGNVGMNLTHTHDYMDIDQYLKNKKLQPAFTGVMTDTYEACSGACFQWYKEYAHQTHQAREWAEEEESEQEMFPLDELGFNPSIYSKGSFDPATGKIVTGQYGFAGWEYSPALDLSQYKYLVVNLSQPAQGWGPSFRLFDEGYWDGAAEYDLSGKTSICVDLQKMTKTKDNKTVKVDPRNIRIVGFWTLGGEGSALYIKSIYVSNDGLTPAALSTVTTEADLIDCWQVDGRPTLPSAHGLQFRRMADGTVRKVMIR